MKSIRNDPSLTRAEKEIAQYWESVLHGSMLVIDPSSISSSSMPGYAVYSNGKLQDSGTIDMPSLIGVDLFDRLRYIAKCFQEEFAPVDILVIEAIPPVRFGGNPSHHASLLKSIGAAVVSARSEYVTQIYPVTWKKYIDSKYEKSDAADAEYIGKAVVDICKKLVYLNKSKLETKAIKPSSRRYKNVKLRRKKSK